MNCKIYLLPTLVLVVLLIGCATNISDFEKHLSNNVDSYYQTPIHNKTESDYSLKVYIGHNSLDDNLEYHMWFEAKEDLGYDWNVLLHCGDDESWFTGFSFEPRKDHFVKLDIEECDSSSIEITGGDGLTQRVIDMGSFGIYDYSTYLTFTPIKDLE